MKTRIFKWDNSRNKKYKNCNINFDFVKGCVDGSVIWWNESYYCVDLDKIEVKE